MRYLVVFQPGKTPRPPSPELDAEMARLVDEGRKSGELVMTGGLLPASMGGARVKREDGVVSVLDGPFAEAKEVVVGYAIIEVPSREAAIASTRRFLDVAGDGECEVRPLMD